MAVDNQVDVNELAEVEAQEAEIEADNPSLGTEDTALGGEGDGDLIATAGCPVEAMLKAVPQQEPRREEELDRIQNDEYPSLSQGMRATCGDLKERAEGCK
eukprot:gene5932-7135_t